MAAQLIPAPSAPILEVQHLEKAFRKTPAVAGLDLTVRPGELLGLIGPNGAGKSTTVKMITGQLLPDRGRVLIAGRDITREPLAAKRLIGYVPQDVALYPFLTGRELLEFVAEVRGVPAPEARATLDALLERFHLAEAQNRMTREYSEGMARKLAIAAALIGRPPLLLLDESLNGLDPRAASEVKTILKEELARGTAVVLVSHILDVLERLCTHVVLIDRGRAVASLDRPALVDLTAAGTTLEDFFIAHTAG